MWSAEVDGKHLGLFPTEEEAHEKRAEYIKNRSWLGDEKHDV